MSISHPSSITLTNVAHISAGEISLSEELEPLLHGMIQWQGEVIQLRDTVNKQREVIHMLKDRHTRKSLRK